MAITYNHGPGKATSTGESVTANAAGATAGTVLYLTGPARDKSLYNGKANGRYIKEASGANGTYRWIEDFQINAAATPATGFTADNI